MGASAAKGGSFADGQNEGGQGCVEELGVSGVLRVAVVGKLTSKMRASSECGLEALGEWV